MKRWHNKLGHWPLHVKKSCQIFHKVVQQHVQGVVGSLITTLL